MIDSKALATAIVWMATKLRNAASHVLRAAHDSAALLATRNVGGLSLTREGGAGADACVTHAFARSRETLRRLVGWVAKTGFVLCEKRRGSCVKPVYELCLVVSVLLGGSLTSNIVFAQCTFNNGSTTCVRKEPDSRWRGTWGLNLNQVAYGATTTLAANAVAAGRSAENEAAVRAGGGTSWTVYEYVDGSCENDDANHNGSYEIVNRVLGSRSKVNLRTRFCAYRVYQTDGASRILTGTEIFYQLNGTLTCPLWQDGYGRPSDKLGSLQIGGFGSDFFCGVEEINKCEDTQPQGNPISASYGNKIENLNLGFANYSLRYLGEGWLLSSSVGSQWIHTFSRALNVFETSSTTASVSTPLVQALRDDGTHWRFPSSAIEVTATGFSHAKLLRTPTGYRLTTPDDTVEQYNATGRLLSITTRAGVVQTLNYEANPPSGQEPKLLSVVDSYGRSLTFTYHPDTATTGAGNIATVTDHLSNTVSYAYDANNNLATVTYPGGSTKTYHYNEQVFTQNTNLPNALTGITDENGVRYATYQYDAQGRAISTEHAGGVDKYQLNYVSPYSQTIVTDPLGTQRTYNFQTILGVVKTTGVSQPCPSCGGTQSQATTYDANGNVASKTDFNNKKSCHAYDLARNLETARVEGLPSTAACSTELAKAVTAFTAADQKKVQTTWHATYRLPLTITEPAAATTVGGTPGTKLTEFTYDAAGNMLTRKVTAPRNDGTGTNEIRVWTYTYNSLGQVLTAKDPLNRTTTTAYYAATDTAIPPKWTMGDVQTITNAAGHVVTFNEYDKNGRATKMTDANGLITTMAYHPRGWLTSRAVSNGPAAGGGSVVTETTTYTYDNVGQLTKVTLPDQSTLFYAYDDAHRLVGMSDQLINASPNGNGALIVKQLNLSGNRILYTLDNMGNRIKEAHYDPAGSLQKQKQRAIDALNRLKQDIGGSSYASAAPAGAPALDAGVTGAPTNASITQYAYDNNGNVTSTTDPLGRTTTNQYDALNRLTQVIDPQNGATKPTIYQYDSANNLVQVTDPQGLQTKYTYNGHNNLIDQSSPDTGSTKFQYNAIGNVIAKIDSGNSHVAPNTGRCTTTVYDNLHRPTTIKYYAASNTATNTQALCFGTIAGTVAVEETHSYTYDAITASLGGPGGKGRVSRIADAAGRVDYVYDLFGRITSKTQVTTGATNPNRVVTYQYSNNGRLRSMTTPSGQTIAYTYGAPNSANPGKIVAIMLNPTGYTATAEGGNVPTGGVTLLSGSLYEPFGPNGGWSWGNHGTQPSGFTTPIVNQHLRIFDLDYRPIGIQSDPEGYNRNIAWDRANRITSITVPTNITVAGVTNANSLNQAFAYDQLDRLTNFNAGIANATTLATGMALLPSEQFTYDAIGNRLSRTTTAPGTT
jgi:YD repeat-containing protein